MKRAAAFALFLFLLVGLTASVFGADAAPVTLTADRTTLEAGQTVTLRLLLREDVSQRVTGWQWNLIWDSSYLELVSAEAGDAAQGVTPIVNTTRVTTSYAAPYTCVSITQGNTLTPHTLKKGVIATLTLRAKNTLAADAATRIYLDRVIVMDETGTALSVAETDAALLWGADRTAVPDGEGGLALSLVASDASEPSTQPSTEPSTEPTTSPSEDATEASSEPSTQPEPTQESSTEPGAEAPSESVPENTPAPVAPSQQTVTEAASAPSDEPVFYTVTFLSNGGTAVASQRVEAGARLSAPEEPEKDGWRFNGWYQDEALTTIWDFSSDTVTQELTLYAGWLQLGDTQKQTASFSFPLWLLPVIALVAAGAAALYFFFAKKKVSFDTCGGTVMDPVYVRRNALLDVPMTPVKPGAIFLGWYTHSEGGTQWNFAQRRVQHSLTLYARWK